MGFRGQRRTAIYVITTDRGVCKVGISHDPLERLANLQTAAQFPLRLHYVAYHSQASRLETLVHHMLKDKRTYGEWFSVPDQVAQDTILEAAESIGMPIGGYGVMGRTKRAWFFIALWMVVLAGFGVFLYSLAHQ